MKVYLVGGAVRDELLKRTVLERDWVVVGATPELMLKHGFTQVGKDFPVFLHPDSKEEYALARTERKVAKGYKGFTCDANQAITLEEDLLRRDLTINAIAKDKQGALIDPYHGVADIQHKLLRHVSTAFTEDPVRILRIARFAARFPDFQVAKETQQLMCTMVKSGEVQSLVPERVWKEFARALSEPAPWRFLEVLAACGALAIIFPQIQRYYIDAIKLITSVTPKTVTLDFEYKITARFVVLTQAIKQIAEMEKLCQAYKLPKKLARMAGLVMKYRDRFIRIREDSPERVLDTLNTLDAFRQQDRFKEWLRLCQLTSEILDHEYQQSFKQYTYSYEQSLAQLSTITATTQEKKDLHHHEIGQFISNKRLEALNELLPTFQKNLH